MIASGRTVVRVAIVIALIQPGHAGAASAQAPSRIAAPADGSRITVQLVTMGPGRAVWERFAHNAIWIRDPDLGIDRIYNYGIFDFDEPGFLVRYVRGNLLYMMDRFPAMSHLNAYVAANRSVWLQELNLTAAQRVELRDFLLWNDLPENRRYRYDYYYDNCSTRVRDALDRVLGGRLRAVTEDVPTGTTFRFHTQRSVYDDVWTSTGLLLALAQPVDAPIDRWEEMFLPMKVMEYVRDATVIDETGDTVPLVRSEQTFFEGTEPLPPEVPPQRTVWYLVVGVLVAVLVCAAAWARGAPRWARVTTGVTATAWTLLLGVAGVVIAGLWFLTDHTATYRNENLFFFNPVALPLVALVPLVLAGRSRWRTAAAWLAYAVAGLSVLGFVAQAVPGFDQTNGELIALALPPNVALAWVAWRVRGGGPGHLPRQGGTRR